MSAINTSPILFRYMITHLAARVAAAVCVLAVLVAIIDTAELYRRLTEKEVGSLLTLFSMIAAKVPAALPELIPFGVLVGGIASYQKMRQSHEIIAARASGLSQFRLALPGSVFALLLAVVMLAVLNPIASATAQRYDALESRIFGSNSRNLTVSTAGIWLRDQNAQGALIIHGDSIGLDNASIANAVVYNLDPANGSISERYYPESMLLREGRWELRGGRLMDGDGRIMPLTDKIIATDLRQRDLSHSNKPPETIPVIELWSYIKVLQKTGLPTLGHSSYLYAQLALPLVLMGMLLIVARLTLGFGTRSGWVHLVVLSLVGGMAFYFIKDFLFVMGTSGRLPPVIAGFAPGAIMVSLGVVLLMRADER